MYSLRNQIRAGLASLMLVGTAAAQQLVNGTPIIIPENSPAGVSSPYPSTIEVIGGPRRIQSLSVTLRNINHSYSEDIRALLVAPSGQTILLVSGVGSNANITGQTWTFRQESLNSLPTSVGVPPTSGTYRPTASTVGSLPLPAPPAPYGNNLAALYGTDSNGLWKLYVADQFPADSGGAIQDGWTLNLVGDIETEFTYQGILSDASGPISGDANLRFTLFGAPFAWFGESELAPPVTKSLTGISRGLVTTELDFGEAILDSRALWLSIEVDSPPGSGYVVLSPRQAIGIAPQAGRALIATRAERAGSVDWTGITSVPPRIATPPALTQHHNLSLPADVYVSNIPADIDGTSASITLVAGQAVMNWSISGFTNAGGTSIQIRPRLGTQFGPWTSFVLGQTSLHQSISGSAVFTTVQGNAGLGLQVRVTGGGDGFRTSPQNTFNATVINFPQ